MINIKIKTIPPGSLPYNRVGDWQWKGEQLFIWVNDFKDERYEFLIAIHEIIEAYLCKMAGVKEEVIDQFDQKNDGKWTPEGPGYKEHLISTGIESILAGVSGVIWDKYEAAIQNS